jgi:3-deoxy-D-manno-octulosonic-acid transferase
MEFETATEDDSRTFADRLMAIVAKFSGKSQGDEARFAAVTQALEAIVDQVTEQYAAQTERFAHLQAAHVELRAELFAMLDGTEAKHSTQRPVATGAGSTGARRGASAPTDC